MATWILALGVGLVALASGSISPASAADVTWMTSHDEALAKGKAENKPVIIDMWAEWCVACKELAKISFKDDRVKPLFDGFVLAKIDMDAKENKGLWKQYEVSSLPQVYFLKPDGTIVSDLTLSAFEEPAPFAERMKKARATFGLDSGSAGSQAGTDTAPKPSAETAGAAPSAPKPNSAEAALDAKSLDPALQSLPEFATAKTGQLHARLVSEADTVAPGETFHLGVHFHMLPGWHVYWKSPGDSGRPTTVAIDNAQGLTSGDILWPMPQRFDERGEFITYGYTDQVVLPVPVEVPKNATAGPMEVKAEVHWLICEKNCVPGTATLKVPIVVGDARQDSAAAPLVKNALAKHPGNVPSGLVVASTIVTDPTLHVRYTVSTTSDEALGWADDGHGLPIAPVASGNVKVAHRGVETQVAKGAQGNNEVVALVPFSLTGPVSEDEPPALETALHLRVGDRDLYFTAAADVAAAAEELATSPTGVSISAGGDMPASAGGAAEFSLLQMLLFAFIGGIILNIMPCVLPVLSLKAMSLVKQSGEDKRAIWMHGIAYTAGVLGSFLVLALLVVGLKASGELVGWGFQFQNPWFVAVLAAIVFGFSLSMFGVYELTAVGADAASKASSKGGYVGSFANGAFATVLSTPCTAPFLGPAMGFAFTQPSWITITMFMVVGMGLALPFLLLARFPALIRKIPRGGNWMEHFKHIMGFLLIATVVWLLDVLSDQVSPSALIGMIAFLGVISVAAWMYGRFAGFMASGRQRLVVSLASIGVLVGGALLTLDMEPKVAEGGTRVVESAGIAWQPFSNELVEDLAADGKTVLIDFTASWCITCKSNKKLAIETDAVRQLLSSNGVVTVRGDYTNGGDEIAQWLRRFNRVGVPLNVVIPGDRPAEPILLPELLTEGIVVDALEKAGPSRADDTQTAQAQ